MGSGLLDLSPSGAQHASGDAAGGLTLGPTLKIPVVLSLFEDAARQLA